MDIVKKNGIIVDKESFAIPSLQRGREEMNWLVYLVYPALLAVLLWKVKIFRKGEWNEGWLSVRQTKAIQGFAALCIILHHISQKTCADWLPKYQIIPGLEPFVPIGYILVSIFLFCSGYGLYRSYATKENYLKGFVKRRVLPVVLTGYLVSLLYFFARLWAGEKMTPFRVFGYLSCIRMCNTNGWFVYAMPLFYIGFYLAFRFCKKERTALFFTSLVVISYVAVGTYVNHNDWVMGGEWWYNSAHAFLLGLFFAKYEKKLVPHLQKHYALYLVLALALLLPLWLGERFALGVFSYYGEYSHLKHAVVVGHRWVCLISQMLLSTDVLCVVGLLGMKMKIGNQILDFLGTITLELYLVHGLFVELISRSFLGIKTVWFCKNVLFYVILVTAVAIPLAMLLKKIVTLVFSQRPNEEKNAR